MKEKILELIDQFVYISENLSPTELWVVMSIAVVLLLFITYRTLGFRASLAIALFVFFVYVLYDHASFDKFKDSQKNEAAHQKKIHEEMDKNILYE